MARGCERKTCSNCGETGMSVTYPSRASFPSNGLTVSIPQVTWSTSVKQLVEPAAPNCPDLPTSKAWDKIRGQATGKDMEIDVTAMVDSLSRPESRTARPHPPSPSGQALTTPSPKIHAARLRAAKNQKRPGLYAANGRLSDVCR